MKLNRIDYSITIAVINHVYSVHYGTAMHVDEANAGYLYTQGKKSQHDKQQ